MSWNVSGLEICLLIIILLISHSAPYIIDEVEICMKGYEAEGASGRATSKSKSYQNNVIMSLGHGGAVEVLHAIHPTQVRKIEQLANCVGRTTPELFLERFKSLSLCVFVCLAAF